MWKNSSFLFPEKNAREATLEKNATVYPVKSLKEVVEFLQGKTKIVPLTPTDAEIIFRSTKDRVDFSEVKGQNHAKRAIEIAVAGAHNLLFIGPPGSGKTMLARRIPTILPPLTFEEALEITKIYSVTGQFSDNELLIANRPFRAPHYSISSVALIGGGSWPKPGEITLSHRGILFLDEFPEFRRDVLESLRIPLEDGKIMISRIKSQICYPARITLIAAMNPCPCGYLSDPRKPCRCSLAQIQKYQTRISGPILDRIDLHVEVPSLSYSALSDNTNAENSATIRKRVLACRDIQTSRYRDQPFKVNARIRPRDMKQHASPSPEGS